MGKLRPVVFILAVCGACLFIVSYLNLRILTEKYFAEKKEVQQEQIKIADNISTLNVINKYQKIYFDIITRNDVLLPQESNDEVNNDEKILAKLFEEVKGKINPNNPYLQKFNEISEKYAENSGENTYEINNFAQEKYQATDDLLNEVYQVVINKLPEDDAKSLRESELDWIEQVNKYHNHFDKQEYGTIKYLAEVNYECNMRSFRTLLLMLYMN